MTTNERTTEPEIEVAFETVRKALATLGSMHASSPGRTLFDGATFVIEPHKALTLLESTLKDVTEERDRLQRFIDNQTPGQCADCPGGTSWEDEALATTQKLRVATEALRKIAEGGREDYDAYIEDIQAARTALQQIAGAE